MVEVIPLGVKAGAAAVMVMVLAGSGALGIQGFDVDVSELNVGN